MKPKHRKFAGALAIAALLAIAGLAQAQDTGSTDAQSGQTPMMNQGTLGGPYCQPGCVVAPVANQSMMGPGMMNQMPMMGPGMMGQGMNSPGMMGWAQMPMMPPGMMGQGMMGPGMMYQMPMMGGMTGPGMMGPGMMMNPGMMNQMPMMGGMMGQGTMGPGMMGQAGAYYGRDLTGEDVSLMLEHHLAMTGLPNLAVGSVEEQDADTIVAEIVTRDGTVVQRLSVDRHSWAMTPLE
jgi:hypothetical protein